MVELVAYHLLTKWHTNSTAPIHIYSIFDQTSPNSGPSIQCRGGPYANKTETQEDNNDDAMDILDTIVTAHSQDVTGAHTNLQAVIILRT